MTDSSVSAQAGSPAGSLPQSANGAVASEQADGPAGAVGRVAGTEDSTPLQFAVALDEASYLQLDDVVVTLRQIPGVGPVLTEWHRDRGPGPARGCELRLGCLPYF